MRIVAALGGNALLRRGETPDASVQAANVQRAEGNAGTIITPRGRYGGPDDLSPRHGGDAPRRRRTGVR